MNDLQEDIEIPRKFSDSVARALMNPSSPDYVCWTEFLRGFPIAVRQRRVLWDEWNRRMDLQGVDIMSYRTDSPAHEHGN